MQFQELGFMFSLSERRRVVGMGTTCKTSLGAIPKDDERVRAIFDATHFVGQQWHHHSDRLDFPGLEASATVMEESLDAGFRLYGSSGRRHRLSPPEVQEDVGLLGWRVLNHLEPT